MSKDKFISKEDLYQEPKIIKNEAKTPAEPLGVVEQYNRYISPVTGKEYTDPLTMARDDQEALETQRTNTIINKINSKE